MLIFIVLCTIFIISQTIPTDPLLYLVKLSDPDALCLDGSPSAYYISKQGDPNKILIQFEGGGWCWGPNTMSQTIESCYQRSKTDLGSSLNYKPTISLGHGVLSTDERNNFKDWTRVYLKYCDGSGHQGTKKNPLPYKGTNLYFRGHNSTIAKLNSLEKNNKLFSEATHVVVGGGSAGGLAAFLWADFIKERVKNGKVWALPDSGIFLNRMNVNSGKYTYKNILKNLMSISNVQIAPPVPLCVQKFGEQEIQNCMFAQNIGPLMNTSLFMLQPLYDTWSIAYILGIPCVLNQNGSLNNCSDSDRMHIQEYHRNTSSMILSIGQKNGNGYFAPACAVHTIGFTSNYYNENWRIPQNSDYSASKSIENWLNENSDINSYRRIDMGKWPDNKPCSGQITKNMLGQIGY